jgi:hypothetical protein
VVLPPEATFSKGAQSPAIDAATAILKGRGDQPRQKQNRLIFLAPDTDCFARLKDQVTSALAWKSIVDDVREGRLNLDGHQNKQASASLDQANEALGRMVRETFKWLLAPLQEAKLGKGISEIQWDHFQINPAATNRTEEIEKVLKEHELLITEWAPVHLAKMLQTWFWKDDLSAVSALETWQKTCCYLYLPRLREADTLRATIAAGVSSRDFFGVAYSREEGNFQGFNFAHNTTPILDASLLLIEPKVAAAYAAKLAQEASEREAKGNETTRRSEAAGSSKGESASGASTMSTNVGGGSNSVKGEGSNAAGTASGPNGAVSIKKTMFFGSVELDSIKAKLQFSEVADEVLMLFTQKPGTKVRISVEIEAESSVGFDDGLQRAVRENCDQLKFKNRAFEG